MIERKIISGHSPEHIEWVLKEWAKTPTHVLQGITKTLDGADTAPLLPQVTVPTLVLAPANSPITPLDRPALHAHGDSQRADCHCRGPWARNLCGQARGVSERFAKFFGVVIAVGL